MMIFWPFVFRITHTTVADIILTHEIITFVPTVKYVVLFFLRSQTHNKLFAVKILHALYARQYFSINPTRGERENLSSINNNII